MVERAIEERVVSKELFESVIKDLRDDVHEIRETMKWANRALIGQLVALIVAIGMAILVLTLPQLGP